MRVPETSNFAEVTAPVSRGLFVCALMLSILLSSLFGPFATVHHVGDAATIDHGPRVVAALLPDLADHHHHHDVASEISTNHAATHENGSDHPDHFVLLTKLFMHFASSTATLLALALAVAASFAILLRFIRLLNPERRTATDSESVPLVTRSVIARLLRSNHALLN